MQAPAESLEAIQQRQCNQGRWKFTLDDGAQEAVLEVALGRYTSLLALDVDVQLLQVSVTLKVTVPPPPPPLSPGIGECAGAHARMHANTQLPWLMCIRSLSDTCAVSYQ